MKTGDRVVCIDDSGKSSALKKGREYIIYGVKKCKCGRVSFDVGLINPLGVRCFDCKGDLSNQNGIDWCDEKRFRKVEEKVNYVKLEIEVEEPCLN